VKISCAFATPSDEAHPESERHLAIHEGHLALTGTADQLPEKIAGFEAVGVTELVYQPARSDIERELRAFASAAGLAGGRHDGGWHRRDQ
jgi:5,10-methylenetetrahydromethanopterin reductase